ncbi:MAG TPA: class I SAM-dependent methyltransferase [Puia sp.]|jgi:SAM-dependent methyltransferase|nr:class I SAM-dependent methyltransferase [Puia sp.]
MLFETHSICPVCRTNGVFWCNAMDWEYRATDQTYTYLQCPLCLTLFIKRVPDAALSLIYPLDYYSFSGKPANLVFKLKNSWDAGFYRSSLKSIASPALSVLDIGGGTGEVLDVIKTADKRIGYAEIVDIDQAAQNIAINKGYAYTCTTIEKYVTERKFHLILLLNVIEHVENPLPILNKAEEMLLPGGIIIIKTPNADSLDARVFKNYYWGGLHCPRHWIIFSDTSFKKIMESSNLTLKKISFTQGAPFWTYSILQLFRKKAIHQKKKPLIEHPLFGILSIFFAAFDICRSVFSKTSQMFIVLTK